MASPEVICTRYPISDTLTLGMIRELVLAELAARKMNLNQLAKASGVAYRALHDWLSEKGVGTRGPSVENVERVLRALNITVRRPPSRSPKSKPKADPHDR